MSKRRRDARHAKDPQERRRNNIRAHLKRAYGISVEEYERMFASQGGVCAICANPPAGTNNKTDRLVVDHSHETGKIRALLCHGCNAGLGGFRDKQYRMLKAIEYLSKHGS